jgi:hypothetical protein
MRGIEQYLQVDAATLGALKYAGTWNASTNTPTLTSGVGTQGQYYVVSVAGNTNLDGETNWQVGDWAVFNGSVWQKVDGGSTGLLSTLTVTGNTYLATTSGNVGVGNTSPAYKLDVTGTLGVSGLAEFADGTAAAPSIANIGDNNTGMYWPSADAIALVTAGVNRLRVTSAGDVGIGTTAPGAKLETSASSSGATLEMLRLSNIGIGANTKARLNFYAASTNYGSITGGYGASAPEMIFDINTSNGSFIWNSNAAERMRITSTGDVGIGTSSPSFPLDVNGFMGVGAKTALPGVGGNVRYRDDTGTQRYIAGILGSAGETSFSIYDAIAGDWRVQITSAGNVGIGTTSPSAKLDVSGGDIRLATNATYYRSVTSGGTSVRMLGINAGNVAYIGPIDSGPTDAIFNASSTSTVAAFYTSGTERMRITSTGDVGIGTSSPGYKLDVVGYGRFSSGLVGSGGLLMYGDSSSPSGLLLTTSGNHGRRVTPNANWGVNHRVFELAGASTAHVLAYVNGISVGHNYYVNSGGSYIYTFTGQNATRYAQSTSGNHIWFNAPSGTAGNTISFTQAMTLDASGNFVVGASSANARIDAVGGIGVRVNEDAAGTKVVFLRSDFAGLGPSIQVSTNHPLLLLTNNTERLRITATGNVHTPAGTTTMTDGFIYIPAAAGVPTGAPTAITGTVPMYYDTTNNKFYIYNGAWKSVALL